MRPKAKRLIDELVPPVPEGRWQPRGDGPLPQPAPEGAVNIGGDCVPQRRVKEGGQSGGGGGGEGEGDIGRRVVGAGGCGAGACGASDLMAGV